MSEIHLSTPFQQDTSASNSPLSPLQYAQIGEAQVRCKRVRRATVVAAIDAWTSAIFAVGSLAMSIFSPMGILVGIGFCAVGFNSFRGLWLLKRMDLRGPRVLAVNQLLLAALVTAYSVYSMWDAIHNPGAGDPMLNDPTVKQALGDLQPLMLKLTLAVYGLMIVGTIVMQGLTAWYYASRRKYLAAYLNETPAWVIELQKKQAGS